MKLRTEQCGFRSFFIFLLRVLESQIFVGAESPGSSFLNPNRQRIQDLRRTHFPKTIRKPKLYLNLTIHFLELTVTHMPHPVESSSPSSYHCNFNHQKVKKSKPERRSPSWVLRRNGFSLSSPPCSFLFSFSYSLPFLHSVLRDPFPQ